MENVKFKLESTDATKFDLEAFNNNDCVGSLRFEVVDNPFEYWYFLKEGEYQNEIGLDKYILLDRLFIDPSCRRDQLRTRLMNGLIKIVKLRFIHYNILLEADAFDGNISQDDLIKFYQKFGFVQCGDFKNVLVRIT
jgi:GNAT superfamily N-acetyltransferase